jgi:excisionase family DNA binding protein
VDIPGAAKHANVTDSQIRRWLRAGVLPYSKPSGGRTGRVRIDLNDLDALMLASRREAIAGPLVKSY